MRIGAPGLRERMRQCNKERQQQGCRTAEAIHVVLLLLRSIYLSLDNALSIVQWPRNHAQAPRHPVDRDGRSPARGAGALGRPARAARACGARRARPERRAPLPGELRALRPGGAGRRLALRLRPARPARGPRLDPAPRPDPGDRARPARAGRPRPASPRCSRSGATAGRPWSTGSAPATWSLRSTSARCCRWRAPRSAACCSPSCPKA